MTVPRLCASSTIGPDSGKCGQHAVERVGARGLVLEVAPCLRDHLHHRGNGLSSQRHAPPRSVGAERALEVGRGPLDTPTQIIALTPRHMRRRLRRENVALVAGIAQRVGVLRRAAVDAVEKARIAHLDQRGAHHIAPRIVMLGADAMEVDQRGCHEAPIMPTARQHRSHPT